ncbi:MAG TPA: hypothetical protein PLQ49_05550 [Methanothrix sp.]|nr:hypothetical protein [Methanothrix sp.]
MILWEKAELALSHLESCDICPRGCAANRLTGEFGHCGSGRRLARVSSFTPYFVEEPPLIGANRSGTISMMGCNLSCVLCQNYEISPILVRRAVFRNPYCY